MYAARLSHVDFVCRNSFFPLEHRKMANEEISVLHRAASPLYATKDIITDRQKSCRLKVHGNNDDDDVSVQSLAKELQSSLTQIKVSSKREKKRVHVQQ